MSNQFCECTDQGRVLTYCPRYQRDMAGRMRQICAGIDCDLGTAAAFREQWRQEAGKVINQHGEIVRDNQVRRQRTKSDVLKQRKNAVGGGCCNMFANQQGCDCLDTALPDNCGVAGHDLECVECGVRLYGKQVDDVCRYKTAPSTNKRIPLLLKTDQAPGDAVCMTAAIYSLHKAHPGKYITAVESYWPEVFEHNPDVAKHVLPDPNSVEEVFDFAQVLPLQMHYPAIHQSNQRGIHFMQGWCEHLSSALGVPVPLMTNRPRLYFNPNMSETLVGGYWLVCSGGKHDLTNKLWGQERYQEVVNRLLGKIRFIQVGGAKPVVPWNESCAGSQEDDHPPLNNVFNWVGKTTLRQLFEIVRRARGVVCGVSLLMHVAAALEKPAIVIAGGREPVQWNSYPKQHYLHTVGVLPCSTAQGEVGGACWRSRVLPMADGCDILNEHTCQHPVGNVPECMTLIKPSMVADLVLMYNKQYG